MHCAKNNALDMCKITLYCLLILQYFFDILIMVKTVILAFVGLKYTRKNQEQSAPAPADRGVNI